MLSEMSESKLAHKNCLEMIGRKLTVAECEALYQAFASPPKVTVK